MENKQEDIEVDNYSYKKSGIGLGLICGLFLIFGLIGGFLYPQESLQREEFIGGWKLGAFFSAVVCVILIYLRVK